MTQRYDKHVLNNGMVILGEPMQGVGSAAFNFVLPAGAALLPHGSCGAANVIADWVFRGAGDKNSRQLSDALDGLGLQRAVSAGTCHISAGGVLEAGNLHHALNLYAQIIMHPALHQDEFELSRQLAIEAVLAMDDEPRQKVMLKVRELFYPNPWGRSTIGEIEQLKSLTAEKTARILQNNFNLSQTIFSVAGRYDFHAVCAQLEHLFDISPPQPAADVVVTGRTEKYKHLDNEGAQVHIGLMTETVNPRHSHYYQAMMAVTVLSGGMSSRLFTEVREKRALCYAIGARYHGLKDYAGIMCYAGTTPDNAQQTVDVIKEQFNSLAAGISAPELQRASVGLKSALILQSESSSSRAAAIAGDYYIYGRVRSLDEIKEKIEQTTVDSILAFLRERQFTDFTAVTIGPRQVTV
ncbi:MAG TPA: pitrilysin family protein [Sedimentisphaerales bacterium]|nr:pitrilysin family protein [Sedimentisphaerales bacterium]